mmetsp:Transcript_4116/g.12945  ORF Transcript_4116/g.12945 Transcript_4116/m.12945 type:complete len:238 (-) Transcript_4116:1189-1902(-)
MEDVKKSVEDFQADAMSKVQEMTSLFTSSVANVSSAGTSAAATGSKSFNEQVDTIKDLTDTGIAHYKAAEEIVFSELKGLVLTGMENPNTSMALIGGTALLVSPVTRGILYRMTIGRFRSEESVYRSCERKMHGLKDSVKESKAEFEKLEERVKLAEEEYERGRRKLSAAAGELKSLHGRVGGGERRADTLVAELRRLPSKAALSLRSEAAESAAALRRQRTDIERRMGRIDKTGVV